MNAGKGHQPIAPANHDGPAGQRRHVVRAGCADELFAPRTASEGDLARAALRGQRPRTRIVLIERQQISLPTPQASLPESMSSGSMGANSKYS